MKKTKKTKYEMPSFIKPEKETAYFRWLGRKAMILRKRDERYGCKVKPRKTYKEKIHEAVLKSNGKDFYTGLSLDWSLISRFNGNNYHSLDTSVLPTVDHFDGRCSLKFVICSWLVNDMKGNMSYKKFLEMCAAVINNKNNL